MKTSYGLSSSLPLVETHSGSNLMFHNLCIKLMYLERSDLDIDQHDRTTNPWSMTKSIASWLQRHFLQCFDHRSPSAPFNSASRRSFCALEASAASNSLRWRCSSLRSLSCNSFASRQVSSKDDWRSQPSCGPELVGTRLPSSHGLLPLSPLGSTWNQTNQI